ncbi:helix-turn-helix domain-containing protein [Hyphomicrobium sp. NDB2Meth4]|uniref:winged helix-turn-helix transcriptional regulator n=1 Tax=Hyphomicrobium sp. NDB2Meth4 TaxID=1892846 RepID=UPI001FCD6BA3|nr:helix-turn-helix domain-containing protein [Hyphomicrobium sp. NDB2Meth4]
MKYAPFGNYLRRDVSMVSKHVLTRGLFGSPTNPEPPPTNVYVEACPSRAILELIADKWTLLILPALRDGRMRNSDLMRLIGGVSQKMLTQTLRELERNGIVNRIDHHEVPPRVEYELSPLGRSLSDLVRSLGSWAEEHLEQVIAARDAFEAREKQKP